MSTILRRIYDDQRPEVRACVVSALGRVNDEGSIFCLIEACLDPDVNVRLEALTVLNRALASVGTTRAGAFAESAFRVLAPNLEHGHSPVRSAAVSGVKTLQYSAPALVAGVIPSLSKLLGDPLLPTRRGAAAVLAHLGEPALEELIHACGNADNEVREVAIQGISWVGRHARKAFPVLLENLVYDSPTVRAASIDALKNIGAMDEPLVIESAIARLRAETALEVAGKISDALVGIPRAAAVIEKYEKWKEAVASNAANSDTGGSGRETDPDGGFGPTSGYRNIMGNWGE